MLCEKGLQILADEAQHDVINFQIAHRSVEALHDYLNLFGYLTTIKNLEIWTQGQREKAARFLFLNTLAMNGLPIETGEEPAWMDCLEKAWED